MQFIGGPAAGGGKKEGMGVRLRRENTEQKINTSYTTRRKEKGRGGNVMKDSKGVVERRIDVSRSRA